MQPLRCTGHTSFQSVPSGTICRPQPRTLLFEDAQVEALHEPHNPLHDSIKGGVFSSSGALTFVRSNLTVTWANKTKSDKLRYGVVDAQRLHKFVSYPLLCRVLRTQISLLSIQKRCRNQFHVTIAGLLRTVRSELCLAMARCWTPELKTVELAGLVEI